MVDSMDCSLPDSPVHGSSPGKNTRVGCRALLQGIFPTQGSNPGVPHCRKVLYHLSYLGSPPVWMGLIKSLKVKSLSKRDLLWPD